MYHSDYRTVNIAERFYTLTEAADRLEVNRLTIRRWIRSGKLEAQKVGGVVFIERELIEAMKTKRQGG